VLRPVVHIRTLLYALVLLLTVPSRALKPVKVRWLKLLVNESHLLVDEVLCARLSTRILNHEDILIRTNASQERVNAEAFPIPPALGNASYVCHRAEDHVDTLVDSDML
jgi:hypothetical protein